MVRKYRIQIRRNTSAKQQYHFIVLANNSKILLTSENYKSKQSAMTTAKNLMRYMLPGVVVLEDV